MKQKIISGFIAIALFASPAFASVDCGPAEVKAIQSQNSGILIRISISGLESWKSLGLHTSDYTKSFQALAQQALATNLYVVLRYPDGYDCTATDYGTAPMMIRITKE